jgi:hypothetical protein
LCTKNREGLNKGNMKPLFIFLITFVMAISYIPNVGPFCDEQWNFIFISSCFLNKLQFKSIEKNQDQRPDMKSVFFLSMKVFQFYHIIHTRSLLSI